MWFYHLTAMSHRIARSLSVSAPTSSATCRMGVTSVSIGRPLAATLACSAWRVTSRRRLQPGLLPGLEVSDLMACAGARPPISGRAALGPVVAAATRACAPGGRPVKAEMLKSCRAFPAGSPGA